MPGTPLSHSNSTIENARACLREMLESSTSSVASLCIQPIVEAGLQAANVLESRPEVHELAAAVVQHIDDVCESLNNISQLDQVVDLENDMIDLLQAIGDVTGGNLNVDESEVRERAKALEGRIENEVLKLVCHVLSFDERKVTLATVADPVVKPSPAALDPTSQTNDDRLRYVSDTLKTMHSLLDHLTSDEKDYADRLSLLDEMIGPLRGTVIDLFKDVEVSGSRSLDNATALLPFFVDISLLVERLPVPAGQGNRQGGLSNGTLEAKQAHILSGGAPHKLDQATDNVASTALHERRKDLAIEFLEQSRSFLCDQVARQRNVELEQLEYADLPPAERFSTLCRTLDFIATSEGAKMMMERGVSRKFEEATNRLQRALSHWKQTVEAIRNKDDFEDFLKPIDYAKLRAAAAEGPIIILVLDKPQDRTHALIVSALARDPLHLELLAANRATMEKLVSHLREGAQLDQQWKADKAFRFILRRLWDIVVGPISEILENLLGVVRHTRIWWCPTGILSSLPFHAAGHYPKDPSNNIPHSDLNLPDKYISSYTPTLQALARARHDRRPVTCRKKILVVAQPDTPRGWPVLCKAEEEAKIVQELAGLKMDPTVLLSREGTRTAVLEAMAKHPWLHLVCHGLQNPDQPLDSCFALYDGDLTLRDVIKGGLPNAEFAFLASCHSATGDSALPDEVLHLAAGLLFAGFRSVVGTIWEVADDDGPKIAEAFYRALGVEGPEGEVDISRAAYALNEAVRSLRNDGVPLNRWVRYIHIGI